MLVPLVVPLEVVGVFFFFFELFFFELVLWVLLFFFLLDFCFSPVVVVPLVPWA